MNSDVFFGYGAPILDLCVRGNQGISSWRILLP